MSESPLLVRPIDLSTRVVQNISHGCGYWSLWLHAPAIAKGVEAGQFVMVGIDAGLRPYLRRAFSIADVDGDDIEILGKTVGPGTAALERAPSGTRIALLGPLGKGFDLDGAASGGTAVLVAGGVGVAPFLLTARQLSRRGVPTRIHFGGRSAADLVGADRLGDIVGRSNLTLATDDGSAGVRGRVTAPLAADLDSGLKVSRLFACGPEPMFVALEKIVRERRLTAQFALEKEMACGFGVCLGCVVPTTGGHFATLCREGPCVDPAEIDWNRMHT